MYIRSVALAIAPGSNHALTVKVLYEDSGLLAVDKPAGVVVIPARGEDAALSLRHRLEAARGERVWVVHRIDRETSGVVLFARSAAAHRALNELFASRAVEKSYVAFTLGARIEDGLIDLPLHTARKGKMRPATPGEAGAVDAQTRVEVLARWAVERHWVTKLRALPRTGRQHQLRVHLRAQGAAIVGDPLYSLAPLRDALTLGRMALHAEALTLPWAGERLTLRAEVPERLASFERALGEPLG